jgi:ribonuclease HI
MQLVKKGVRWSVGDGKTIKLLTDNWIPNFAPGSLRTLAPIPSGASVDFCLNESRRAWDVDTVRSVFEEDVANQILQIPISRRGGEDFVSWPFTKFGVYTVRSAYNMARTESFFVERSKHGGDASSAVEEDTQMWKKLWAISAPGKMKIHLWRFAHDCLPSGVQLCRRHIPADTGCIHCNLEETAAHAFLFCQYAKEVWREIKPLYNIQLRRKFYTSNKTWVFDFLARASVKERCVLAVGFWHLWLARNGVRNGEPMKHPHAVAEQIKAYVEMIELHILSPSPSNRRDTSSSTPRWSPPPEGTVLINVDAALFSLSRRMGIGVVIRNHIGECLLVCSQLQEEITTPEIAEALAVRRAVTLAAEEGFDKVRVLSDCLSLVQRLLSDEQDRSYVGVITDDIKLLRSRFSSFSVSHIRRCNNKSAHILARSAEQFISFVSRNCIPECIRQTICNDLC